MGMKANSGLFQVKKYVIHYFGLQLFASSFEKKVKYNYINYEKQIKHLNGTKNASPLLISYEDCEKIVKKYSGKGTMVNEWQEVVNIKQNVGLINVKGKYVPTTWIKIHYSKTGSHIVPYYQKKGE